MAAPLECFRLQPKRASPVPQHFKKATFEFQSMQAVFQIRFNFFIMLILEYVVSDQWGEKLTKKDFSTRIPKNRKLVVM